MQKTYILILIPFACGTTYVKKLKLDLITSQKRIPSCNNELTWERLSALDPVLGSNN